jgi:predicted phage terminase large subunit-like protein
MTSTVDWAEHAARAFEVEKQTTFATPGELAKALDPATRQTAALDLIDAALVDVAEGRCDRLIISLPPQEGKSERCTHYGALFALLRNPDLRIGVVSYDQDTSQRFSYAIRNDILTFDGDEGTIDLGLRLRTDSKAATRWNLAGRKGGVYAVGIGGALTGRPFDMLVIDDPVKDYRAADSTLLSETAWNWWMSVARPRLAPGAPVIVILTRWHEDDLAGRMLAKQAEDEASDLEHHDRWRVVNIPAQADHDPGKGETDPLGRAPGEYLDSARGRTREQWEATKAATSARIWAALYQGRPSPGEGALLKRHWWRRYEHVDGLDEVITSWDMTFKDTKGSDFVVGQVWGRKGADAYLLDQVRGRWDFPATCRQVEALAELWPTARTHLVEDKANGPAVIAQLRSKVPGMVPVNPKDSKYARASAVSPFIEAGNAHLPETSWVDDFIEECAAFPIATHDDQVDAMSQALDRLLAKGQSAAAWGEYYRRRSGKAKDDADAPSTDGQ